VDKALECPPVGQGTDGSRMRKAGDLPGWPGKAVRTRELPTTLVAYAQVLRSLSLGMDQFMVDRSVVSDRRSKEHHN